MRKRNWLPLLIAVILFIGISAWEGINRIQDNAHSAGIPEDPSSNQPIASKPAASKASASNSSQTPSKEIQLTFLGDILCHPTQYQAAETESGYDFRPSFEDIKDYTSHADLTLANLETTLSGKARTYSGYPSFNTPEQLALAMKETLGVDVVSTANNHSLDRHFPGLAQTIDFLDLFGLKHTGTYKTEKDSQEILLTEIKGLSLAFLSYTYGTNGVTLPSNKLFAVNYIDREKIRRDAQKARSLGADLVIASIHWGQEYASTPSPEQQNLARWIFQNTEIDIISGNHVHAVQPIEFLKVVHPDNGKQKEGLVIYAQGNFISDQQTDSANKGILVNLSLSFDPPTKEYKVNRVEYAPTWVDETPGAGLKTYRVLPVEKALQDYQVGKDSLLSEADYQEMLSFVREIQTLIQPTERIIYHTSER